MAGHSKKIKNLLQDCNLIPQDPENRQVAPWMPPEVREQIIGDMIREIFKGINLEPKDHMECFRAAVKKCNTNFFDTKTLAGWTCHKMVHEKLKLARDLSYETNYLHCLPAPDLIAATMILQHRRIYSKETVDIIKWFNELKMCDVIDTAISVYGEHKTKVFHLQEPCSLAKKTHNLVAIHSDQHDFAENTPALLERLDSLPREKLLINFNNNVKLVSGLGRMELEHSIWGGEDALRNEYTLTRAEVLEKHGELLEQVMKSGNDKALESIVPETFGEREIQVLPREWKRVLLTWSNIKRHEELAATIKKHLDTDKIEITRSKGKGNAWKEDKTWLPGARIEAVLGSIQKFSEVLPDDSLKKLMRVIGKDLEVWAQWSHANDVAMEQQHAAEEIEFLKRQEELDNLLAGLEKKKRSLEALEDQLEEV